MKKFLLFVASAAAILCSCNKQLERNKSVEAVSNDEIPVLFDNYVNRTKAQSLPGDSVKSKGFGVFAFSQETMPLAEYAKKNFLPNFMYNQQVISSDGKNWTYSPVKYWPNNPGAMVSFFAYAPYVKALNDSVHTVTPNTVPSIHEVTPTDPEGLRLILGYDYNGPAIEYNLPSDPTMGVDLMWGEKKNSEKGTCPFNITKPKCDTTINFQFRHALSRLDFDLQVVVDEIDTSSHNSLAEGTGIKVKSVTLIGSFAKKGVLKLYDGIWNVTTGNIRNIVMDTAQFSDIVRDTIKTDDAAYRVPLLKGVSDTAKNAKNNYLMVIPKALFNIEIVYDVVTVDPTNKKNNSTVTNTCTSTQFKLEQGHAYAFHLVLGMTSAKFSAEIEDWQFGGEEQVDLPGNEKK